MTSTYQWSRNVLFGAAACVMLGATADAQEPNNAWSDSTVLAPDVRVVEDDIFSTGGGTSNFFDLTLGAYGNLTIPGLIDDDSSPLGNGLASALFGVPIGIQSTIRVRVSGFPDFDFDGLVDGSEFTPHSQSGDYDIYINVFNQDGVQIEEIIESDSLAPGEVDFFEFSNPDWMRGTYDVILDNGPRTVGGSDVDFYSFTNLPVGAPFIAEVTEGNFDTILGWFDSAGNLIEFDDDAGLGVLSRLEGTTPDGGTLHLAVTGYSDFSFDGGHVQSGDYRLELTVVPEPGAVVLMLAGIATGLSTRRRYRMTD